MTNIVIGNWGQEVRGGAQPVYPSQIYDAIFAKREWTQSSTNKLSLRAFFTLEGPPEYAGSDYIEFMTLGSDDDPQALKPDTRKQAFGWGTLRDLLAAIWGGVDAIPSGPVLEVVDKCLGYRCQLHLEEEFDNLRQRPRNNLRSIYSAKARQAGTGALPVRQTNLQRPTGGGPPLVGPGGVPPTALTGPAMPRPTAPPPTAQEMLRPAAAGPATPAEAPPGGVPGGHPTPAASTPPQEGLVPPGAPPSEPASGGGGLPPGPPPPPIA